ncbi:uncharacterized protein LOC126680106 [Mercurialis annua]|uniref:uncharacterized protein LOC126680106 n=1 Tax=Mercurialis annua TaxID=3986 RepID=UPI002160BECC|nr:uncharacterized protein LOC126680106 [Mercurialis annua]
MAVITTLSSFSRPWFQPSWLYTATFLAFTTLIYVNIVSCSKHDIPNYSDHCSSFVPELTPTDPEVTIVPFSPEQDGYFLDGDELLNQSHSSGFYVPSNDRRVLLLRTHHVYRTRQDDVFKVEASLILQPSRIQHHYASSPIVISSWSETGVLNFEIEGFWSKSTGKICMIGSSSTRSGEGKHSFPAVVRLTDVSSSTKITSLIRGTLESLGSDGDSSYFHPISFLMFPLINYTYTEVTKEADSGCPGGLDVAKSSLSLPLSVSICSPFSNNDYPFQLEYAPSCNSTKNCSPFEGGAGILPPMMSLRSIQCSDDGRRMRFLLEFHNISSYSYYGPFDSNTTLVAEGSWNARKNQLCAVACRISTPTKFWDSSQVEDCSMRLSLRFPSVLSIINTSSIVGHIWSNKTSGASGYFDRVSFHNQKSGSVNIPGLKYEYSLVDRAKKSCPKKQLSKSKGKQYPRANPYNLRFSMSFKNSKGKRSRWGSADTFFVGDKIVPRNYWSSSEPGNSKDEADIQPMNMSYHISWTLSYNDSSNQYESVQISAEGVYDGNTGVLCMMGCKKIDSTNQISTIDSMDCEILINIQFPPMNSKDYIEGYIKSTREKTSPLYFESLTFSSVPNYNHGDSIWRMDMEIITALIFNTLACVSVAYQILYMKKNPGLFPFISRLMLVVLILGRMIPLVLNFEALFLSKQNRQYAMLQAGGWVEANEVLVRAITMVAFLLQFRLLQLVWSAKPSDENKKASWIAEKKTLYVCLPLFVVSGLIALSINWKNYKFGEEMNSRRRFYSQQQSLWTDFTSYAGLVLDGFLFPQIVFNIFRNSREYTLSCFFYIGTTLVRILPHGYDLYRTQYSSDNFEWSYMYADHSADYYSTAWNVMIPLVGLLFAAIVFMQQRNGGRSILPKRFKEVEAYERVPLFGDL